MVVRTVQSRVRATAIVLSEEAERSFVRDGKCRAVTVDVWCNNDPSSRFVEALLLEEEDVDGIVLTKGSGLGWIEVVVLGEGAVEEIW